MTEVEELRRLLGWVAKRARAGCFSHKRTERDQALADISAHTGDYAHYWTSAKNPDNSGRVWYGESP